MKHTFLAILSLGVVGLVSAAPVPAGGFYGAPFTGTPNFPYPYPGGSSGVPGIPGLPGAPQKTAKQMCNCNNPATKETVVSPFCAQAGGQEQYRVFDSVEPIKQHMCILSSALSDEIFTSEKCRKELGLSYNAFCGNFFF